MAREIAIGKRARISKAQQYTILAVVGAGIFLGVAIALVQHFTNQISFNAKVIGEEDKVIATYSDAIKSIGVCKKPAGNTYTDEELKKCNPDSINVSEVPNTLRSNILVGMAKNKALSSVPKESNSSCINTLTGKPYTYDEMQNLLRIASAEGTSDEINTASELIQSCSALRVIPDALPAFKNEEALLSSLNKIFILSNWEPESLSPTGSYGSVAIGNNLSAFSVRLSVESDAATTRGVLSNIERSIREFNVERATIEWGGTNTLVLQAQATAYYTSPSALVETTKIIKVGGK